MNTMVKGRIKLVVVGLAVAMIGLGGCKKTCYECSVYRPWVLCIKNYDTVSFYAYANRFNDTINLYNSSRYCMCCQNLVVDKGESLNSLIHII